MVKKKANKGWEIVGNQDGTTNLTKEEFEELGNIFREHTKKYTENEHRKFEMIGVHAEMTTYIDSQTKNGHVLDPGHFIKKILDIYGIPQQKLATYLGLNKSNFSALMSGSRKINFDLALKLAHIFGISAELWLQIQNKNELQRLRQANQEEYEKYSLAGLLEQ